LTTSKDLLCQVKGSALERTFSGAHQLNLTKNGGTEGQHEVFIDRDQGPFEALITYLRNEMKVYPHFETVHDELYFAKELEFWGVPNAHFEEKRLISKLPSDLVKYLATEPVNAKTEPMYRWKELGPMSIMDIMKNSNESNPIIFGDDIPFGKA